MTITRTTVSHPSYGGTLTLHFTEPSLPERVRVEVAREFPGVPGRWDDITAECVRYLTTGEGNRFTAAWMTRWAAGS